MSCVGLVAGAVSGWCGAVWWGVVGQLVGAGPDRHIDVGEVTEVDGGEVVGEAGFGFGPGLMEGANLGPVAGSASEDAFVDDYWAFDDLDDLQQGDLRSRPAQGVTTDGS